MIRVVEPGEMLASFPSRSIV